MALEAFKAEASPSQWQHDHFGCACHLMMLIERVNWKNVFLDIQCVLIPTWMMQTFFYGQSFLEFVDGKAGSQ